MKDDFKNSTPHWTDLYYDGEDESEPILEETDLLLAQLTEIISNRYLLENHKMKPNNNGKDLLQ